MDTAQWVTMGIAAMAGIPGILAFFKRRPGQKERDAATVAEGLLNTAKGTVDLITDELQEQFKQAVAQRKEIEAENRKLVEALAAANRQISNISDELFDAHAEIRTLRAQVQRLSAQVASMGNGDN
jgi:chromosome segregation ATPase